MSQYWLEVAEETPVQGVSSRELTGRLARRSIVEMLDRLGVR